MIRCNKGGKQYILWGVVFGRVQFPGFTQASTCSMRSIDCDCHLQGKQQWRLQCI